MVKSVSIETALPLPAPDIEALIQGRMLAAIPRRWLDQGKQFALYPTDLSINYLQHESCYKENFLPIAKRFISNLNAEKVTIKAWARCELCQMVDNPESLKAVSQLTVWKTEALEQILSQRPYIFLAHLRVYLLSQPIEIPVHPNARDKRGKFIPLPHRLMVSESSPILSDRTFTHRRHQLENRLPPLHPELEELQSAIAQLTITNPNAEKLHRHLKIFLGWESTSPVKKLEPKHAWISTINALGNATTGGNYEKGTAFEQIVHKSLIFLHFELDPNAKGGVGGMDLYCTKPYPLVGECKAGKSIPDHTVERLDRIGRRHLGKAAYEQGIKLIIGPGEPTKNLKESAKVSIVSIIKPMTLQKLVELEANYPGSVNPIELKAYLGAGQSDGRIDEYIEKVIKDIQLRSQIVQAVKELTEQDNSLEPTQKRFTVTEIRVHYNATQNPKLTDDLVHDLLVELSSPLTGYLGREKGSDWKSDRFYFLRELN